MKVLKILTDQDLPKTISRPVVFGVDSIEELVKDMFYTMKIAGGIGLAAPQVGVFLRIIVADTTATGGDFVGIMINPKIVSATDECEFDEGCLSFPGRVVKTKRNNQVTVEFYNLYGHIMTKKLNGIDSVCIQHEIDHLDGKTFFDRELKQP